MIAYDLKCGNNHVFEGWFDNLEAFEDQKEKGLVSCPVCDDARIERLPSTFAIRSAASSPKSSLPVTDAQDPRNQMEWFGKQVANYIEKNFDDVGCNFAQEALKIHYGAAEPRNIRGSSSDEEEKVLRKEGIKFLKFPVPAPPDRDDA